MATPATLHRAVTRAGVLVTALWCAGGCTALGPDTAAAAGAADRFHAAVADGDGAAACALLAPGTVSRLEGTAGVPCEQAVVGADLPETSGPVRTHAAGRMAQVVLRGDTVFLTLSGRDWLVTAAGCTPRPERPYDCTISGG